MGAHHHHHHGHQHSADDTDSSVKRIGTAFVLNMLFAIIELVGGILSGSFAIVADAIHDFGDSLSLALALYLQKKSTKGPSSDLTYGYKRYSILSSLISGLVIIAGSILIIVEAVPRLLGNPEMPHVPSMIALALLGLVVNGLAAFGLSRGHSHNEKILSWHLIEDFLGWLAVFFGALCIYFFQVAWLDPLLAIMIALFIMWNVVRNLKVPLKIILQFVPNAGDLEGLKREIKAVAGVIDIEEFHAWTLDGYQHVMTMRLRVQNLAAGEEIKAAIREKCKAKAYLYMTIELVGAEGPGKRYVLSEKHGHADCAHPH